MGMKEEIYLHPTKGFRGSGLKARTNKRVKVPKDRRAEALGLQRERVRVKYWTPTPQMAAQMAARHVHPRHKRASA